MTLALAGTAYAGVSSVVLTTTSANCVVIVCYNGNGSTPTGVSDTTGLTWTLYQHASWFFGGSNDFWYAIAPSILTATTITVALSPSSGSHHTTAFAVSGALLSAPFDTNPSLPNTNNSYTGGLTPTISPPSPFSTTNKRTMVFSSMVTQGGGAPITEPSGYSPVIATESGMDIGYQIFSSAQSNLNPTYQMGSPPAFGGATVAWGAIQSGQLASGVASNPARGSGTVQVTVGNPLGGTSPYTYQWYRSTTSGFTPGAGNIVSGATSQTLNDTGLTNGTTYYYVNIVTDSASGTDTSNQVAAVPAPPSSFYSSGFLGM